MTFVHPAYLWLLVLGLTPVAIYYLLRFRSLRVNWGANYVLELALARLRRNWNWAQVLLMALRILACLALVLVFARPASQRAGGVVTGTGTHHILVIDGSCSTLAGPADPPGQRRWDQMMSVVKKAAATWGRGEKWSLCFVADKPRWLVEGELVESPDKTLAKLESLKPGETSCSLAVALGQVAERAGRGKVEIFIAADDQATTWSGVDAVNPPGDAESEVYWLRPGGRALAGNLAVLTATPAAGRALAGHPTRVVARVKSFADRAIEDINLDLLLDGSLASRKVISLQPGQELETSFELKIDRPGPHYLEVQLPADDLDYDNRQFAALEVVEMLRAVVLRDASREGKLDSVWGFLEVTERGRKLAADKGEAARGTVAWSQETGPATAAALATADVVVLDAGSPMSAEWAGVLSEFVRRGGGIVIAGDASIDAAKWNAALGGVGLLPAKLGAVNSEPVGGDKFRSLLKTEMSTSALRLFESQAAGDWSQARFYAWRRLDEISSTARVVGVLEDQSPWAVLGEPAGGVGLGRVLVLATGLAGRGGNLVVREFFVPLVHQCVLAAAGGRDFPRTVTNTDSASLRMVVDAATTGATFSRQGGEMAAAGVRSSDGLRFAEVDADGLESGLYNVMAVGTSSADGTAGRRAWFGVQGVRVDSDLTPISDAARASIAGRWGIKEVSDWASLEQALSGRGRGSEWQHWVILALVAALFGEMAVQRVFSPRAMTSRLGGRGARPASQGGAA